MRPIPILKYSGLTLFIIGIILNVWMFFALWWPTYLFFIILGVGALLFFLSFPLKRLRTLWQTVIAITPFLSGYIVFKITDASHDIFLIPSDFRGNVIVIYGQQDGQRKEYEGHWRIYRVPKDGILKTQFKLKGNAIDLSGTKYFFIDGQGHRTLIQAFCEYCKQKDTLNVQIVYGSLAGSGIGTTQDFFVGIPNISFYKSTRNVFSIVDSLDREKSDR